MGGEEAKAIPLGVSGGSETSLSLPRTKLFPHPLKPATLKILLVAKALFNASTKSKPCRMGPSLPKKTGDSHTGQPSEPSVSFRILTSTLYWRCTLPQKQEKKHPIASFALA